MRLFLRTLSCVTAAIGAAVGCASAPTRAARPEPAGSRVVTAAELGRVPFATPEEAVRVLRPGWLGPQYTSRRGPSSLLPYDAELPPVLRYVAMDARGQVRREGMWPAPAVTRLEFLTRGQTPARLGFFMAGGAVLVFGRDSLTTAAHTP